jgi:hypothetical protein
MMNFGRTMIFSLPRKGTGSSPRAYTQRRDFEDAVIVSSSDVKDGIEFTRGRFLT